MLNVIRILFLILVSTVASAYLVRAASHDWTQYFIMIGAVVASLSIITVDLLTKKKNLSALAGLFFGILVGLLLSTALSYLIDRIVTIFVDDPMADPSARIINQPYYEGGKVLLGLMITYITVTFVLQTKDDFRFIIPYVEFARATKGPRPLILDTSVIIDGRIVDVAAGGVFESRIIVPRFVLNELQAIADSGDRLKRARGRRGLDVLQRLQASPKLELHIWDGTLAALPETEGVDQKLVALAQQESGRIVTNDFNLNKVAQLRGVEVINLNQIADALKPVVLPGEPMRVRVVKPGEASGQGVGYLEDGTMVVVENARDKVGQEVQLTVTNALQTSAGKMIFGRLDQPNPALASAPATAPPANPPAAPQSKPQKPAPSA